MKKAIKILLPVLAALILSSAAVLTVLLSRTVRPGARVVFLSPSTQRENLYADGKTTEAACMNAVADEVQRILTARGYTVRRSDPEKTFREAVADSLALAPSVHVALHSNAAATENTGAIRGCEAYARRRHYGSYRLAECIYARVAAVTPTEDRGVRYSDTLAEVTRPSCASTLVELDFHDCADGAAFLTSQTGALAQAVADGIEDYFTAGIRWRTLLRSLLR